MRSCFKISAYVTPGDKEVCCLFGGTISAALHLHLPRVILYNCIIPVNIEAVNALKFQMNLRSCECMGLRYEM